MFALLLLGVGMVVYKVEADRSADKAEKSSGSVQGCGCGSASGAAIFNSDEEAGTVAGFLRNLPARVDVRRRVRA